MKRKLIRKCGCILLCGMLMAGTGVSVHARAATISERTEEATRETSEEASQGESQITTGEVTEGTTQVTSETTTQVTPGTAGQVRPEAPTPAEPAPTNPQVSAQATTEAAVQQNSDSNGEKKEKKYKINPKKKMVALTFDDGPGRYTKEIVNCLKKNNGRATFFVLGCNVNKYPKVVKAADKIGCEIANHSYNHSNLAKLSGREIKKQMKDTDKRIKKITGKKTAICRTPGGSISDTVKESIGKPVILWSIDTLDWKTRDRDKTVNCVMKNVKDGDIVLMHDIHEPSKEAALILIEKLKKKGYQLVTVSELAEYRGYDMEKGGVYRSFPKKKAR